MDGCVVVYYVSFGNGGEIMKKIIITLVASIHFIIAHAQTIHQARDIVQVLCSDTLYGRGYVHQGSLRAANFITHWLQQHRIKKIQQQSYALSVNTHPNAITCTVNGRFLQTGETYLIDACAPGVKGLFDAVVFNWKDSQDRFLLQKKCVQGFLPNEALIIRNTSARQSHWKDSIAKYNWQIPLLIFTEEKKLTHTICDHVDDMPIIIGIDSVFRDAEKIYIDCRHEFISASSQENIIACIKGKNNKQSMVFTAHYDHLGKQGNALFPGGSDNASGVSMVMQLAAYYRKHKPPYKTYFIFFSGEEAGLKGSAYFTQNPTFDLDKIKALVNIDIMGNAQQGITVVNGESQRHIFDLLTTINKQQSLLPEIKLRGKAANSDHYFFAEKNVPAIFIYSMGGPGYYHDIYDNASSVEFIHYDEVMQLLLTFVKSL